MVNNFAVIGNPIDHSLSPIIHQYFSEQTKLPLIYKKIKGSEQHFSQQVNDFFNQGGKGLNVTLPFKQQAFAMADEVTDRCKIAKASNTLWKREGRLYADNTDGIGLIRDLKRHISLKGKRILVLGAGGAVRGILQPLLSAKPDILQIANRTLKNAQMLQADFLEVQCTDFLNIQGTFDLVINGTSASLSNQDLAIPNICFANKPFCYDLAYSLDKPTNFMQTAHDHDCKAVDGLGMLVEQAAEAFYIWHGVMPETDVVLNQLRQAI